METPRPRSRMRALALGGLASVVALIAAIGASAGTTPATAADSSAPATQTQLVQQASPTPEATPDGRGPGGEDCPEKDGSSQRDDSAAPGSTAIPAPAPEL